MFEFKVNSQLGSYRDLDEVDSKSLSLAWGPENMSLAQKASGIFAKVDVELPNIKPVRMTIGVEETTDKRYGGFKFRVIDVSSNGKTISNPFAFETQGEILNTIHNGIINIDGVVQDDVVYGLALEFVTTSKENVKAYKERGKNMRKSINDMRNGVPATTEAPATVASEVATEMAGAVV